MSVAVKTGEALLESVEGSLRAARQMQLVEYVANMGADGCLTYRELRGNLLVLMPLGNETQDFEFALGQRLLGQGAVRSGVQFFQHLSAMRGCSANSP